MTSAELQNKRAILIRKATGLIFAIARKPQSIKLLEGAIEALERFATYKTGRNRWSDLSDDNEPA